MICSRCGTKNSKNSKFCNECGKRLVVEALERQAEANDVVEEVDPSAVAELLHEALQSYERTDYEAALTKCQAALRMNPGSPSGRSLLALIFEKKADEHLSKGNREDGEDFLRAAIRQTERVLVANPASEADKETLAVLRIRLQELTGATHARPSFSAVAIEKLKQVPLPWVLSIATFVVILGLLTIVKAARTPNRPVPNPPPYKQSAQKSNGVQGQSVPQQHSQPYINPETGLPIMPSVPGQSVWSYAPPSAQPGTPQPAQPSVPEANTMLPPITPEIDRTAANQQTPLPVQPSQPGNSKPAPIVEAQQQPTHNTLQEAQNAYARRDYHEAAELYREAINKGDNTAENHQKLAMCLYNLQSPDAAVNHFQKAIELYTRRKTTGEDVDSAINTCKLYMDFLARR